VRQCVWGDHRSPLGLKRQRNAVGTGPVGQQGLDLSSSATVTKRIAVLGGADGLVSVSRATRDDSAELTVIVTSADDRGPREG
jgi:hypothetical protein